MYDLKRATEETRKLANLRREPYAVVKFAFPGSAAQRAGVVTAKRRYGPVREDEVPAYVADGAEVVETVRPE